MLQATGVHRQGPATEKGLGSGAGLLWAFKELKERLPGQGGFPGSADGKESTCDAGDPGSIPELGRSPGGGHGNPFQYSCLENLMDRGAWRATVCRLTKSQT